MPFPLSKTQKAKKLIREPTAGFACECVPESKRLNVCVCVCAIAAVARYSNPIFVRILYVLHNILQFTLLSIRKSNVCFYLTSHSAKCEPSARFFKHLLECFVSFFMFRVRSKMRHAALHFTTYRTMKILHRTIWYKQNNKAKHSNGEKQEDAE